MKKSAFLFALTFCVALAGCNQPAPSQGREPRRREMCREHFMDRARRKAKKEARQAMAQDTKRMARAAVDLSRKAVTATTKAAKSLIGALSASDYFKGFKTDSRGCLQTNAGQNKEAAVK